MSIAGKGKISSINTISEQTERQLGFSDAVFAIAMTFLALELGSIPDEVGKVGGPTSLQFIEENLRDYAVYFTTFLIVAVFWWRHHLIYRYIKKVSGGIFWLNIFMLAIVAALPYPAGILSEATGLPLAVVILLVPLCILSILLWLQWELAVRTGLVIPGTPEQVVKSVRAQLLASPIVLAIAILFALWAEAARSATLLRLAEFTWLLLLVAPFVLTKFWPPPDKAYEIDESEVGKDWETSAEVEAGEEKLVRNVLSRLRNGSDTDRVKILTDGVVAIAVTILALQLNPPEAGEALTNEDLIENLQHAPIWTYLVTFLYISLFWRAHVRILGRVVGVDTIMIWLNLIFLMFISFLPMPAALLGHDPSVPAAAGYLLVMFFTSAALTGLAWYATFAKGLALQVGTKTERNLRTLRSGTMLLSFLIAFVCVLIFQNVAFTNLVWVGLLAFSIVARVRVRKEYEGATSTSSK